MKIGVIGGGVVGRATARCYLGFAEEVRVWDVLPERATHPKDDVVGTGLDGVTFLCLPSPQKEDGAGLDVSEVDDVCRWLGYKNRHGLYVLRSTVPVGTTARLRKEYGLTNLVYSPEFLTARCAETDAALPAVNVIGGAYCEGREALENLYRRRFPEVPAHLLTSDEAEAVKLFQNSFFAVKVAYFNELRAFADKSGLDWERVRRAVLADGRVGASHTLVPGPDGRAGFGGHCLPKDLAGLNAQMTAAGLSPLLGTAAEARNRLDRV